MSDVEVQRLLNAAVAAVLREGAELVELDYGRAHVLHALAMTAETAQRVAMLLDDDEDTAF